jgi:hypothetical protein
MRFGDFIVRSQCALGAGLRQLRERRLILSAETEIGDRQRGAGARETRLMARERFQAFDAPRVRRRDRAREALAVRAQQIQRIGDIDVVCVRVVGPDQRHPVCRAGLCTEKLRQTFGERAESGETGFARQLQFLFSLNDTVRCEQRKRCAVRFGVERDTQSECAGDIVDRGDAHPPAVQQMAQLIVEPRGLGGRPRRCHFDPQRFGAVEDLARR